MHPSKLMDLVEFVDVDTGGIISPIVKNYMKDKHPSQFVATDFTINLYEIEISYVTRTGRYVESKKYMYLQPHEDTWIEVHMKILDWAESQPDITDVRMHKMNALGKAVLKIE